MQADPTPIPITAPNGVKLRAQLWSFSAKLSICIMAVVVIPGLTWVYGKIQDHETRQVVDEEVRVIRGRAIDDIKADVRELQTNNTRDHGVIKEKLGGIAEDMAAVKATIEKDGR